jgi:hypothetical protein
VDEFGLEPFCRFLGFVKRHHLWDYDHFVGGDAVDAYAGAANDAG